MDNSKEVVSCRLKMDTLAVIDNLAAQYGLPRGTIMPIALDYVVNYKVHEFKAYLQKRQNRMLAADDVNV